MRLFYSGYAPLPFSSLKRTLLESTTGGSQGNVLSIRCLTTRVAAPIGCSVSSASPSSLCFAVSDALFRLFQTWERARGLGSQRPLTSASGHPHRKHSLGDPASSWEIIFKVGVGSFVSAMDQRGRYLKSIVWLTLHQEESGRSGHSLT